MKAKRLLLGLAAAAAIALTNHAAPPNPGDISTAHSDCTKAAPPHFAAKGDVYLIGKNLPPGNYWVKVTDPDSSSVLGHTKSASVVVDSSGNILNGTTLCYRLCDILVYPDNITPCFDDTPNPGGVYKVWVSQDSNFAGGTTKTHNFKVGEGTCTDCAVQIFCSDDINACNETGIPSAHVIYDDPTVVGVADHSACFPPSGSAFVIGSTVVTCSAFDAQNQVLASCTFNVKVDACGDPACVPGCGPIKTCSDEGDCAAKGDKTDFHLTSAGDNCSTVVCHILNADNSLGAEVHSQDSFPVGITTVRCSSTDGAGVVGSCDFNIEVDDCEAPIPSCPTPAAVCNDAGLCSGTVTLNVTATDNCDQNPSITCNILKAGNSPGASVNPTGPQSFPVGTTQIQCTFSDHASPKPNTATCNFFVVVNDCENPKITCPAPISDCLQTVNGSIENVGIPDATDNCPGVKVAGVRSDFKALTDPYPCGLTTIHWTATDAVGHTATCDQIVTITGAKISATKFYDANVNGNCDDGKVVAGFKISLYGKDGANNPVSVVQYTSAGGVACFTCVPIGSYTVSESAPNGNWVPTTPTSAPLQVNDCSQNYSAKFGNICLGAGGALSKGFWGNSNGSKVFKSACGGGEAGNDTFLIGLNLRDGAGANFDPGSYAKFTSWLGSATAVNMAYMLSAQLAAMELNVRLVGTACAGPYGDNVTGSALIFAPGTASADAHGFATINAIMTEANTLLGNGGVSPLVITSGAKLSVATALKNALDNACNNLNFVQSAPCQITSPY